MKKFAPILVAALAAASASSALACASCGCTLNSDWSSQGLSTSGGWSMDLRLDALDQNQLRTGTGTISSAAASQVTNTATGDTAEVEKYTNNTYLTATLDYDHGDTWGVSLILPLIDRSHSTLGVGSDGTNPGAGAYDSQAIGLGDIRVVGRYHGFSEAGNWGLQFGLKLPTGQNNQLAKYGSTPVDPGLQLGTGTTDTILGVYRFDNLNQNWDYFLSAQYQSAVAYVSMPNGAGDAQYRPGDSVNLTAGLRYHGFDQFTPEVQLNARSVASDSGQAADTWATGGQLVYLTPGVSMPVSEKTTLRASVQLPVYQNLNGIQLAPTAIYSVGVHFNF